MEPAMKQSHQQTGNRRFPSTSKENVMSGKLKIAIMSLMLLGTASAAPAYATPHATFHSGSVNLRQERPDTLTGGQGYYEGDYEFNVDRSDRASSPYAGGGL